MTANEPQTDQARPEIGSTVRVNGILTNYLDAGTGDPVVLVHGSGPGVSAYANWRLTIPALADDVGVLAPDMGGLRLQRTPRRRPLCGSSQTRV